MKLKVKNIGLRKQPFYFVIKHNQKKHNINLKKQLTNKQTCSII